MVSCCVIVNIVAANDIIRGLSAVAVHVKTMHVSGSTCRNIILLYDYMLDARQVILVVC
ncbi:hypothetical protein D3C85_1438670 [compost metagenome]